MSVLAAGFDPSQPRDPAGSATGGQWSSGTFKAKVAQRLFPQGEYDPDGPVKFWPARHGGNERDGVYWKGFLDAKTGEEVAFWFTGSMGSPHHLDMANALGLDTGGEATAVGFPASSPYLRVSGFGTKPDEDWLRKYIANDLVVDPSVVRSSPLYDLWYAKLMLLVDKHRKDISDAQIMLEAQNAALAASGLIPEESEPLLDAEARLVRQYEKVIRRAAKRAHDGYLQSQRVTVAAPILPTPEEVLRAADLIASFLRVSAAARRALLREVALALDLIFGGRVGTDVYIDLLQRQAGAQAERLVAGTQDAVADIILRSADEGWTVPETADAIKEKLESIAGWQAKMLARTDLIALSNGASVRRAVAIQDNATRFKTWLATPDERTRVDHRHAHGQTVPVDQPFTVGTEQLQYPGDPSGSDGNVINCRCTVVYSMDATGPIGLEQIQMLPDLAIAAAAVTDFAGSMLAVYPLRHEAQMLHMEGGQNAEDLHCTLCYFPQAPEPEAILPLVQQVAAGWRPLRGTVGGFGVFAAEDDGAPFIALPDVPGLTDMRTALARALKDAGHAYAENHGYTPHITLAYVEDVPPIPNPGLPLTFVEIVYARGPERHKVALGASLTAAGFNPAQPRGPAGTREGGRWIDTGQADVDLTRARAGFEKWKDELAQWYTESQGFQPGYWESAADEMWKRYERAIEGPLQELRDRLESTDVEGAVIFPQLDDGDMDALGDPDGKFAPDFEVLMPATDEDGMQPGFTVWTYPDEEWIIEDVLDITDTDFFPDGPDSDTAGDYAKLVDAARGQKAGPGKTGYVTIYRGMSDSELDAWEGGEEIPMGKFFAGIPTVQYAQDVSGNFPALQTFRVRRDMLMQTGPNEYQLKKRGKLKGQRIEPIQAAGFDPSQPRAPEGTDIGGRWVDMDVTQGGLPGVKHLREYMAGYANINPRVGELLEGWEGVLHPEELEYLQKWVETHMPEMNAIQRREARRVLRKLGALPPKGAQAVAAPGPSVSARENPPGTRDVGETITVSGGMHKKDLNEAIRLVNDTIRFPAVPGEPMITMEVHPPSGSNNGFFRRDFQNRPKLIVIRRRTAEPVSTAVHEMGHYLDSLLGQEGRDFTVAVRGKMDQIYRLRQELLEARERPGGGYDIPGIEKRIADLQHEVNTQSSWADYSSERGGALAPVVEAIRDTEYFRTLDNASRSPRSGAAFTYKGENFFASTRHLEYMRSHREMIARSFEQYIAAKNPNSSLARSNRHVRTGRAEELDRSMGWETRRRPLGYMTDEELQKVIEAWDKVLRERNLLRKP